MSYERDDEASESRDFLKKLEELRDIQYEQSVNVGEENAFAPSFDQQGKFRYLANP